MKKYDYLIIGSGIIGLTIAFELRQKYPDSKILIIEKEPEPARHASGRNSGVLHAGFYYTADSLKAKFCVDGNRLMTQFCDEYDLPINKCGKLVVAQNQQEYEMLHELEKRGKNNGSNVWLVSEEESREKDPLVYTYKKALWSPHTSSVDPKKVCFKLMDLLKEKGVEFLFETKFIKGNSNFIETSQGNFEFEKLINCAGLYADEIAGQYGFGQEYRILPFKGVYLKYMKDTPKINHHVYPVPNLNNPFLGVHYTITVYGDIKIGPTAIPAFWREQYKGFENFNLKEMLEIISLEGKLFFKNSFGFQKLAFEEIKKYDKSYMAREAVQMIPAVDPKGFTLKTAPGIRAQLLHKKTNKLVQDFVVESDDKTIHVLNAVSPAFTCSFAFAKHLCGHLIK